MKLIYRREIVDELVQYYSSHGYEVTPDERASIERSAADSHCDSCGKIVEPLVEVGQEYEADSNTAWLCLDCTRAALALFPKEMT